MDAFYSVASSSMIFSGCSSHLSWWALWLWHLWVSEERRSHNERSRSLWMQGSLFKTFYVHSDSTTPHNKSGHTTHRNTRWCLVTIKICSSGNTMNTSIPAQISHCWRWICHVGFCCKIFWCTCKAFISKARGVCGWQAALFNAWAWWHCHSWDLCCADPAIRCGTKIQNTLL